MKQVIKRTTKSRLAVCGRKKILAGTCYRFILGGLHPSIPSLLVEEFSYPFKTGLVFISYHMI